MKHVNETDLALYASSDLSGWRRWSTAVHLRRCAECKDLVEAHRRLRAEARSSDEALLETLHWKRLAAEMTANIHVGLAAGRCVAPSGNREPGMRRLVPNWLITPAGAVAALAVLFMAAWWLNVPASDKTALLRVMRGLPARASEDRGPVVAASQAGIEFRENGGSLGLRLIDAKPVEVSLSIGRSVSAHYVDDDADQVTITTVYVQ